MTSGWGYLYPSVSWEFSCPELGLPAHFPPAAWAGLASFNFKLQFIHFSVMIPLDLTGEGLAGPPTVPGSEQCHSKDQQSL